MKPHLHPGLLIAMFWVSMGTLWGSPVLTLFPASGNLSGPPGSTLGWGFTITNDSNYIEITSAQFCTNPVNFPLICTPPSTGTFTDFISGYNDVIVGHPGGSDPSTVTQAFDNIALTGIGSFVIDPATPIGATDIGQIVLTYRVTDLDPLDPLAKVLDPDAVLYTNYSVSINAPVATSEPVSVIFIALGLVAIATCNYLNLSRLPNIHALGRIF